jgi:hypothetical protein
VSDHSRPYFFFSTVGKTPLEPDKINTAEQGCLEQPYSDREVVNKIVFDNLIVYNGLSG